MANENGGKKITWDWRLFIQILTVVTVGLGMFYSLQANVGILESRIDGLGKTIQTHIDDSGVHMPFSEKVKQFVPRTEIDLRFDAVLEEIQQNRQYAQEHDEAMLKNIEKMSIDIDEMKKILYRLENGN